MINRVRQLVRDYFGFSRVETNGFMVLVPLMAILLFVPGIYANVFSKEYNPYEEDFAVMDSLMTVWNEVAQVEEVKRPAERLPVEVSLSSFDPNIVGHEEMLTLGIPDFLAKRIVNYRDKGGLFRRKKDLARIYDFPDSLYRVLVSYINLPDELPSKKKNYTSPNKKRKVEDTLRLKAEIHESAPLYIDLNKADTAILKQLRGIGPSFSRRIVKYRSLLGGFADKSQLKEVYGLSDSLYISLSDQVYVSAQDSIEKIALNIANFKVLSSHPYISYKAAREILQVKSKRGKFRSLQDLMIVKELDSAQVIKLAPYIVF